MKKYLNTLFITTQGAYLSKEGETVLVNIEKKTVLRVPIHTLDGIVAFGNVMFSPFLLGFCAKNRVSVSMLTENGSFLAAVTGYAGGSILIRKEQYRRSDNIKASAIIAKAMITGKIANCKKNLSRFLSDHTDKNKETEDPVRQVRDRLAGFLRQLNNEKELDSIRGIEGITANEYFSVFDSLILSQKDSFFFTQRNRRPPLDNMNCLLSFIYTILMHDVRSALESVGLDSAAGFLHRDRPGRPGLALDMMEEFRPFIADRLALSLVNLGQIKAKGFKKSGSGAVLMDDATKKIVMSAYQKRKQDEIVHPFINEKMKIGQLFFIQALLLARYLRSDLDGYPVFVAK